MQILYENFVQGKTNLEQKEERNLNQVHCQAKNQQRIGIRGNEAENHTDSLRSIICNVTNTKSLFKVNYISVWVMQVFEINR